MSRVLVTGASRGLGRALSEELTKRNYEVIASARNIDDLKELDVYKKIPLDVTNEEQIKRASLECGEIDILINNAAYTVAGPIEAIPMEEIKKEYETNVIGPIKLSCVFIPVMRNKGKGTIVNISSVADRFAPPFGGSYASAKAALAMISEALYFELKHFGIRVILIEAGSIKTDMPLNQKQFSSPEYDLLSKQLKVRFDNFLKEDRRNSPEKIAKIISDKIEDSNTYLRVPTGEDAEYFIKMHSSMSDEETGKSSMFQGLNW